MQEPGCGEAISEETPDRGAEGRLEDKAGRELEEAACARAVCEARPAVVGKLRRHTVQGKSLSLWVKVPEARL